MLKNAQMQGTEERAAEHTISYVSSVATMATQHMGVFQYE